MEQVQAIQPYSQWVHEKSAMGYTVLMLTNQHSTTPDKFPLTVVYRRNHDQTVWSRPITSFLKSFRPV